MSKHDQVTEPVERREPPAPAPGLLNQPIPRAVWLPLGVVAALAALLLALNAGVLHIYQKHFTEKLPQLRVPWQALHGSMDEAAVRRQFPEASLRCMTQPTSMGDRVCYAAVDRVDTYPALTVAFFLRRGRLNTAVVHVPWWAHGRAADALAREFGPHTQDRSTRLRQWDLQQGILQMNETRSVNPLAWSAVVWTARGTP